MKKLIYLLYPKMTCIHLISLNFYLSEKKWILCDGFVGVTKYFDLKILESSMEWIESLSTWFFSLSENNGVNPFIFSRIFIGAVPFFTIFVASIVSNYNKGVSIFFANFIGKFLFVSAYLYLILWSPERMCPSGFTWL